MQQEGRVEPPDRGRGTSAGPALGGRPQSARSRSRGRASNPSELLARRQQLLAGEPNWQDGEAQARPESRSDPNPNTVASVETSVEAKLESLSELLKAHSSSNSNHEATTSSTPSSAKSIDDVYILLAKKEKDLQLAAELGKVLLEKNDELSKANERITEDYSHKLELLEQDKHKLKRQLDQLDGEYENRLIELQTDCNILKNQLDEQQQLTRKAEKEKSKLIDDLVQQNQRLTSELVEATKSEELLSSQLEQMNEHFNVRLSNRQDHVVQLEALKEEIQIVNQRKQDLERRLKLAQQDKGKLSVGLEESGDKILMLENLLNDKEAKLGELVEEVQELRDASSWLSNELEAMLALNERLCGQSDATANGNLNQLSNNANSHLLEEFGSQRKRSQLIEQLKELRLRNRSRLKANEFRLMNQRQANGAQLRAQQLAGRRSRRGHSRALNSRKRGNRSSLYDELDSEGDFNKEEEEEEEDDDDSGNSVDGATNKASPIRGLTLDWSSAELAGEIYAMLRKFHTQLQQRRDLLQQTSSANTNSANAHLYSPLNSTDDSGISADDMDNGASQQTNGKLAVTDPASWGKLLASLKSLIEELPCSSCQLLIGERADYEQLQKVHSRLCDEMRRKSDELLALNAMNTEQATRVAALEERCAILAKDLSDCDKPKEEIVKLAWKARDEAVERKNNAEISLAKTRIENMQISSQLMEVVQQKGELSQKLAQFEDDIHYITQDSVKAKFTWEEYAEKLRRSKATPSDSIGFNSNPLAQLLSFSSVVASTTTRANTTNGQQTGTNGTCNNDNNNPGSSNGKTNDKSSALDNVSQAGGGGGLMRNFTSNRFNLRFWTRNSSNGSSEKQIGAEPLTTATDKGGNLSVTNNSTANELTRAS